MGQKEGVGLFILVCCVRVRINVILTIKHVSQEVKPYKSGKVKKKFKEEEQKPSEWSYLQGLASMQAARQQLQTLTIIV